MPPGSELTASATAVSASGVPGLMVFGRRGQGGMDLIEDAVDKITRIVRAEFFGQLQFTIDQIDRNNGGGVGQNRSLNYVQPHAANSHHAYAASRLDLRCVENRTHTGDNGTTRNRCHFKRNIFVYGEDALFAENVVMAKGTHSHHAYDGLPPLFEAGRPIYHNPGSRSISLRT